MAQKGGTVYKRLHLGLDLCLTAAAFVLASFIKKNWLSAGLGDLPAQPNSYFLLLLALVVFSLSYQFHGFYAVSCRSQRLDQMVVQVFQAVLVGFAFYAFALYLIHHANVSRLMMGMFALLSALFLVLSKAVICYVSFFQGQKDVNQKKVLVIGSKERARELIDALVNDPTSEYKLVGCLDTDEKRVNLEVAHGVRVTGLVNELRDILLGKAVDDVVFAMPLEQVEDVREQIAFAEKLGVGVRIMPDWQIQRIMYHPEAARIYFDDFLGVPTVALSAVPSNEAQLCVKSFIDYAGAGAGLVLLAPVLLLVALAVKVASRGPVLFSQERCGLNGRRFKLYKFRTMVPGAEELREGLAAGNEMDGPVFKMCNDPRLTRLGKFLRRTSLDELPQLVNVLKGDMSLVGPRPPLPSEVEQYKPWQRRRLSMKPGITCIWQVNGRNRIDFEHWMRLDLEYIDNWSLLLDLKLLLKTIPAVLGCTGR